MEEAIVTPEAVETPVVETPTVETPVTTPEASPEVPQYELPDGTKVDAATLAKEWRDNFMPDYTKKSQENAAIKAKLEPKTETPVVAKAPWEENPDWQPEDYKQFAGLTAEQAAIKAEERVWQKILNESGRAEREAAEREAYIKQETEQLKAIDPKVDVGRVMQHASKYAFASLIPAFQNMKAMDDMARITEERVLKNLQARSAAPVGSPTSGGSPMSFPADVKTGLDKARYALRNSK